VDRRRPNKIATPGQAAQQTIAGRGERLTRGLDRIGLQLTPAQHDALGVYLSELRRWALRVNLTGLRSDEAIIRDGFLRSLACRTAFNPAPPVKAVDVGSGAGFPGLVLKIAYPDIEMVLLEPRRKRATFLRSMIRYLGLAGVRCIQARVETLCGDVEHRGRYDVAFARAVGPVPDVARMVEPLLKPDGRLILQAGQEARDSLPSLRRLVAALGMSVDIREVPAPDTGFPPTCLLVLERTERS
jgi:16S rRNA (guanine527-N7)-methyltransferase